MFGSISYFPLRIEIEKRRIQCHSTIILKQIVHNFADSSGTWVGLRKSWDSSIPIYHWCWREDSKEPTLEREDWIIGSAYGILDNDISKTVGSATTDLMFGCVWRYKKAPKPNNSVDKKKKIFYLFIEINVF